MSRQLCVHILANGSLSFEYEETGEKVTARQQSLEEKIHELSREDHLSPLFYLGACNQDIPLSRSLNFWRELAQDYMERLRLNPDIERLRGDLPLEADPERLKGLVMQAPIMQGAEYITVELLQGYWDRLHGFFRTQIKSFDGSVEEFLHQYAPELHLVGRIYFHLVENRDNDDYPFAFMATYTHAVSKHGKSQHKPLRFALAEYEADQDKMLALLSTVSRAGRQSALIGGLLESGDIFHPLMWTAAEAYAFLEEIEIYEAAGILCRVPDWWKKKRGGVRINITVGAQKPALLGMHSLLDFRASLVVDGTPLSLAEAKKLLSQTEGLAWLKGKWVTLDKERLKQTMDSLEEARQLMQARDMTLSDALRLLISPQYYGKWGNIPEDVLEVSSGQWLESMLEKMRNPHLIRSVAPAKDFKARLRPYQQKGLDWLFLLHSLGFGGCLADDMGLGKTIQVLAFLDTLLKKKQTQPSSLLVLPASLLANWAIEIKRFAPSLRFIVAHPSEGDPGALKDLDDKQLDGLDLVITTYGMVKRYAWVKSYRWYYVILDEAQAIKNPGAGQTRAVKSLNCTNRLILTGTPIENSLTDLWSLFDFLNPGLLGTAAEFAQLCKRPSGHTEGPAALRKVIGPYILRRLKTDRHIVPDLPDKVEIDSYAAVSKKQAVLYQNLVESIRESLAETEGIQRRGLILASLMKFKQICNHPDQYLGQEVFNEQDSGKFQRLREICEVIYDKRERVLVFTQFREITAALHRFLGSVFEREGLVLHGGTAVNRRREMVARFQGEEYFPYFILSVKAGGTGLNLTAANHVIHFDRWWNPAVESQATDRAFRIGQHKNVVVHKFVTRGTVEEKIARMLEEKKRLSQDVLDTAGERWITEMNDEELINLIKMGNQA